MSVWGLRSQCVELFGRTAARLTSSCKLPFTQHVHELDAGEGGLPGVKRLEPQHRPRHPLHSSMVLFYNIIEILDLADFDRGAVLLVVALDGRFIGRTSLPYKFLTHFKIDI